MHVLLAAPPLLALNVGYYLECHGHVVAHAPTGTFALLLAGARKFDAIVVAEQLPDMSGWRLCRLVRETLRAGVPPLLLLDFTPDDEPPHEMGAADVQMLGVHSLESFHERILALCGRTKDADIVYSAGNP